MDVRKLRYFIAVAEEENFTRAAERLHVSQPPLTRHIQALEDELGVTLFRRTPRGVTLTQAGEALLDDARHIQALVEQATERAYRAGKGQLGRLDIGMFGTAMFDTLPKLLDEFSSRHPGVKLMLHPGQTPAQVQALRQGRVSIVFERMRPVDPDIAVELVDEEPVMLALHQSHPLASQPVVDVGQLVGHPMITPAAPRSQLTDVTFEMCRAHGFEPLVKQQAADVATGAVMAACGMGCFFVPASFTVVQMPNLVYRPVTCKAPKMMDLHCFYRRDDESPLLAALLALVRARRRRLN